MKGIKRQWRIFLAIGVLSWTLGSSAAFADEMADLRAQIEAMRKDYETRMSKLQTQLDELAQKQEAKKAKEIDVEYVGRYEGPFGKGGLLIKNPSGFGNVSVGGYADIEFEAFEKNNSTFDQARFVLNLGAIPNERLVFYSEYEIEHGGPNTAGGGGEAKVEQAWVSYLIDEPINLRAGVVLVPFGQFNLYHDSDIQDLTERPLVARRVVPSTWQEAGVGAFGELPLGEAMNWRLFPDFYLNYEWYIINGLDEDISDTGLRNAKGSVSVDLNNNKAAVGRMGLGFSRNLELGLDSYFGKFGRSGNSTRNGNDDLLGLGLDLNFKEGPFELVGDFVHFDLEKDALVDHDNSDATSAVVGPKYLKGVYIEPRFHFWPKALDGTFLGMGFDSPTFTLVGRYDWTEIADDGDAGIGENEERRWTLGLNYRPIESWVFKTEYQWNSTKNEALERGDSNGFMASAAMGF